MSTSKISYSGKIVYVGIDVHKKTFAVTAICDGALVKRATCPADNIGLAQALKRWFAGANKIVSAYEAGFSGFVLHRALVESGIESNVVNPSSIKVATNDRVKTDKRDSKKIATQLSDGGLTGIYVPTAEEELKRLLPRTRKQLVDARTALGIQIKAKLFQFGLIKKDDDRVMSDRLLTEIEEMALAAELKICLDLMIDAWRHLYKKVRQIEAAMAKQAASEPAIEATYRSVPGIGPISARVLSTELGTMSRFKNIKGLYAYTGLTPTENSSGPNVRRGHISRQGSARLRAILVEMSWRAITKDKQLNQIYERIKAKRGGKVAIVAVARNLIGRVRACFVAKTHYKLAA